MKSSPRSAPAAWARWIAREIRGFNREVAIKILPHAFATDVDRRRRFFQEAQAAGSLNHPNILSVHDAHLDGDTPFLVTELVEGTTLRAEIDFWPMPQRPSRSATRHESASNQARVGPTRPSGADTSSTSPLKA